MMIPRGMVSLNTGDPGPYCPSNDCPSQNNTCCTRDDGSPGCCPLANATCCGVQNSCCPAGYACDPVARDCVAPNPSSECSPCQTVVKFIESQGCGLLCDELPPPADAICSILSALGVCQDILNWLAQGMTPQAICTILGMCPGGTCACSYCTRYTYGRCLSLPNHCPSSRLGEPSVSKVREISKTLATSNKEICFDGTCGEDTEGCCLTCF
jgi:hypothetical protein